MEDIPSHLKTSQVWDNYWEDKKAHPEWITVPTYVTASYTNPLHTPATIKAWNLLHEDCPKWLRIHNTMQCPDYHNDNSQRDLKRFYDDFLHKKTENGWHATPRVRLSVLTFGLSDREDTLYRPEVSFPLTRTQYKRYFLTGYNGLSHTVPSEGRILKYDGSAGSCTFIYQILEALEMTGYFMAHLVMSSGEHDEMDVFIQVEKLSGTKLPQAVIAGMALHRGLDGQLRASHALGEDGARSKIAEPFYTLKQTTPLGRGEKRVLENELWPHGIYWEKGDHLKLTVAGKKVLPFPIPGLIMHETNNKGAHIIHCEDQGEDSSYLFMPHV